MVQAHAVHGWMPFDGGPCPVDDEILLDLKFSSGKVLESYYPWDVKWNGLNPGFGDVVAWRRSVLERKRA